MFGNAIDFINQFGADNSARLLDTSDSRVLTGEILLKQVKGQDISSETSEVQKAASQSVSDINYHLTAAYKEINSYLIARYSLPIPQSAIDTSPIIRYQCDITRYLIATSSDLLTEIIQKRYDDAILWLKNISNGKARLQVSDTVSNLTQTAGARITTGKTIDLGGY